MFNVSRAVKESWVAVLIDMQYGFVGNLERETRQKLLAAQVGVIRCCAAADIPLIVLEFEGYGATVGELAFEMKAVPRVTVIGKTYASGFFYTDLHQKLVALRARKLLLMGINASACVHATAHDGINRGYQIVTAMNLIADSSTVRGSCKEDVERWFGTNGVLLPSASMLIPA